MWLLDFYYFLQFSCSFVFMYLLILMGMSPSKPGENIGPENDEDEDVEVLGLMRGLNRFVRRIGGLGYGRGSPLVLSGSGLRLVVVRYSRGSVFRT